MEVGRDMVLKCAKREKQKLGEEMPLERRCSAKRL
jgi:hypothetical protein